METLERTYTTSLLRYLSGQGLAVGPVVIVRLFACHGTLVHGWVDMFDHTLVFLSFLFLSVCVKITNFQGHMMSDHYPNR